MSATVRLRTQQSPGGPSTPFLSTPVPGRRSERLPRVPADGSRNRYFDALRAAALARVLLLHLFGWAWLPLVFPSMGVMFALAGSLMAGSLMAGSLDRSQASSTVIGRRLRRLLPPLWAFGVVLVPVMFVTGWTATVDGTQSLGPSLLAWLFPIVEPPSSDLGYQWALPLWYLRTYLWLMLMSPALLWLWRHWPKVMMSLPPVILLLIAGGLLRVSGPMGEGLISMLTYVTCWMIGFAHHDGRLQQRRMRSVLLTGTLLAAAGVSVAVRYPLPGYDGIAVGEIPVATALFSLGFSMVLMRLPLKFSAVNRIPVLGALLDAINSRAITIYIWGNMAIWIALTAMDNSGIDRTVPGAWLPLTSLILTLLVFGAIVLATGWVEDLAARRRPRLLPASRADARRRNSEHDSSAHRVPPKTGSAGSP